MIRIPTAISASARSGPQPARSRAPSRPVAAAAQRRRDVDRPQQRRGGGGDHRAGRRRTGTALVVRSPKNASQIPPTRVAAPPGRRPGRARTPSRRPDRRPRRRPAIITAIPSTRSPAPVDRRRDPQGDQRERRGRAGSARRARVARRAWRRRRPSPVGLDSATSTSRRRGISLGDLRLQRLNAPRAAPRRGRRASG